MTEYKKNTQPEPYADPARNRQNQRHEWSVERFCRDRGITSQDLQHHPRWSDIVLLIGIYTEYRAELSTSRRRQGVYDAYWGHTYRQRLALRPKGLRKLEKLVIECQGIRQNQQFAITKIQSLRGSAKPNNIGHDNKAKGPCLPPVTDTKREQQECRQMPEDLNQVPW
jgi:hypothetical protein